MLEPAPPSGRWFAVLLEPPTLDPFDPALPTTLPLPLDEPPDPGVPDPVAGSPKSPVPVLSSAARSPSPEHPLDAKPATQAQMKTRARHWCRRIMIAARVGNGPSAKTQVLGRRAMAVRAGKERRPRIF